MIPSTPHEQRPVPVEELRARKSTGAIELKASGRYGRYLRVTKGGLLRIDRAKVAAAARHDGKWVIQPNDDTLSVEDAAQSYGWIGDFMIPSMPLS